MNLTTVNEVRSSALDLQEHLEAMAEMLADRMRDEVRPDGNMAWVQACAQEIELLNADLKSLEAIRDHAVSVLTEMLSFEGDSVGVAESGLRTMKIEVSQGMINQSLLTLTDAKKRGLVRDGEKFSIQLPDGTKFDTELCEPGNKLRERGMIRKFYSDAKIEAGDKIVISETKRGMWTMQPEFSEEQRKRNAAIFDELVDSVSDESPTP